MNVAVDHHGGLDIRHPTSQKGQYVVLKAETDLIIVMSACPQDMAAVNAGMPTDCEYQINGTPAAPLSSLTAIQPNHRTRRVKIAFSVDFDAISHWLGTGCHPDNNMADYSSGIFAGQVGAYRLLDLFKKNNISNKVTWFIPGHTVETFPDSARAVFESGAEIGLHGYAHEGIYQMTEEQEKDVLLKWYVTSHDHSIEFIDILVIALKLRRSSRAKSPADIVPLCIQFERLLSSFCVSMASFMIHLLCIMIHNHTLPQAIHLLRRLISLSLHLLG